mgnify:CR=1 FL=1
MVTITIANQKGGVGKTAVATNLAACFACEGIATCIVDADIQGNATTWGRRRPDTVPSIPVIPLTVSNLHRAIATVIDPYSVAIIDVGGRVSEHSRAAVLVSDLVIIPIMPGDDSMESSVSFFESVIYPAAATPDRANHELQAVLVLNFAQPRTLWTRDMKTALQKSQYFFCDTMIRQYQAYLDARSRGLGVVESSPRSNAAQDMLALYTEIRRMLPNG